MKPSQRYERAIKERAKALAGYQHWTAEARVARAAFIEEMEGPFVKLLSRREVEVLDCIHEKLSNKEIGNKLNVCERTVKGHVSSILEKFEVKTRKDLHYRTELLPKA